MDKMKDQEKEMYIVADIAANCTCGKQEEINSTEWHLYRESFIEGYKQGFEAGVRAASEEFSAWKLGAEKYIRLTFEYLPREIQDRVKDIKLGENL